MRSHLLKSLWTPTALRKSQKQIDQPEVVLVSWFHSGAWQLHMNPDNGYQVVRTGVRKDKIARPKPGGYFVSVFGSPETVIGGLEKWLHG